MTLTSGARRHRSAHLRTLRCAAVRRAVRTRRPRTPGQALRRAGCCDGTTLERALQAIEFTAAQRIILDLRGLSFMDSTGVHLLLRANQRALADGHEFGLIAGSVAVQRPLHPRRAR